jgi:hypothetical protein
MSWPKGREPLIWEEEFARIEQEEQEEQEEESVRGAERITLAARRSPRQEIIPGEDLVDHVLSLQEQFEAVRDRAIVDLLAEREAIDDELRKLGYDLSRLRTP